MAFGETNMPACSGDERSVKLRKPLKRFLSAGHLASPWPAWRCSIPRSMWPRPSTSPPSSPS